MRAQLAEHHGEVARRWRWTIWCRRQSRAHGCGWLGAPPRRQPSDPMLRLYLLLGGELSERIDVDDDRGIVHAAHANDGILVERERSRLVALRVFSCRVDGGFDLLAAKLLLDPGQLEAHVIAQVPEQLPPRR